MIRVAGSDFFSAPDAIVTLGHLPPLSGPQVLTRGILSVKALMELPDGIPRTLRESTIVLPELEEGEGAWLKHDALALIASLKGTTVAISDIVVFEQMPWGYAPGELSWSCDRIQNEADPDYASRSRGEAADFIRSCTLVSDDALFALTFPVWKDAA